MEREKLGAILTYVAGKYGIRLALLFGSGVSGKTHARSDLDIAILLRNPELSFSDLAQLVHELQPAAGEKNLDLALLNRADPLFLRKIAENCILLFGSESEFHRFKILAFRRYQDHLPFLRIEREYVRRIMQQAGA
jgi:predicted nucleotidyltransferase